jgi:hypothetical protein
LWKVPKLGPLALIGECSVELKMSMEQWWNVIDRGIPLPPGINPFAVNKYYYY